MSDAIAVLFDIVHDQGFIGMKRTEGLHDSDIDPKEFDYFKPIQLFTASD